MRIDDDLPPTLATGETAELYGVSRDHLWALAREGRAPVEPLRLGRTLRWPTALVLESLGLGPPERDGPVAETTGPRRPHGDRTHTLTGDSEKKADQ
jgi:predicted DNA-binding transcriptional regulator AlpA